jgi:hypothetical protein
LGDLPLPHVLREYAFIADSRRGAMIGPRGDLVWMCAPSWHDDAVFSALIGGRGSFTVCPADPFFVWGGYYEGPSLIFRSRWVLPGGIVECREALAAPGEAHRAVLVRQLLARDNGTVIRFRIDPRAGFGRKGPRQVRKEGGVWTGETGDLRFRLLGAEGGSFDREAGIAGELRLPRGGQHDIVLEISKRPFDGPPPDASQLWRATENHWSSRAKDCSSCLAPRDAAHAVAVLDGMTLPGGGMAAAATMSLPERAEAGRNYDYRYAWIRDQCYAGMGGASVGSAELVDDAVNFVTARILEDGPQLKPAYRVDGGPVPEERRLRGTRGYPGGYDKIGNHVTEQFQLDAFGESLQLFAAASIVGDLNDDARRAVDVAIRAVRSRWRQPDCGIWELDEQWWAGSRLECVAGLRAVAASKGCLDKKHASLAEGLADRILAETARRCTHPSGRWQRSPNDPRVDASLLMPPIRGGLPPSDSRVVATHRAVQEELCRDGFVYRYRHDERELHEAEGAFLLCGFMASLSALLMGDNLQAVRLFERNRSACGPPGLLSEEFDVQERQLRGNLPQAFVHSLLLQTSAVLGSAVAPSS